jgi:hypothetical protein
MAPMTSYTHLETGTQPHAEVSDFENVNIAHSSSANTLKPCFDLKPQSYVSPRSALSVPSSSALSVETDLSLVTSAQKRSDSQPSFPSSLSSSLSLPISSTFQAQNHVPLVSDSTDTLKHLGFSTLHGPTSPAAAPASSATLADSGALQVSAQSKLAANLAQHNVSTHLTLSAPQSSETNQNSPSTEIPLLQPLLQLINQVNNC